MILRAIAIGLAATLAMDLWHLFLRRAFNVPSLDYCLLGRWLRHMPGGTFRHQRIGAATPMRFECQVGWVAHYATGVVLAFGFVLLIGRDWLARPTLLPALFYGLVTVVLPFFVVQPSLGLGVASARAPRPGLARWKSVATHLVFGVGLWASALFLAALGAAARGAGSG